MTNTDWNPDAYAFITDCDEETLAALRSDVLDEMEGLNELGRGVYLKQNWRKSPRLAKLVYDKAMGFKPTGRRVEKFLGVPAARIAPPAPATADDFAEGM